jgi:hypothetical protein
LASNETYLYRLNPEGEPVPEPDLIAWARWLETSHRQIALDTIAGVLVSTVFLGLDHAFGGATPILWETMIFGGEHHEYQERYTSREDAIAGHAKAVALVKEEMQDPPVLPEGRP